MPDTQFSRQDLIEEARAVLDNLGEGTMSESAYDTAWVARVPNPNNPTEPRFPAAFDWLLRNQHTDGSWGAEILFAHDRVICTLAALIALSSSPYRRPESEPAARRAVVYLNRERPNLHDDPAETVGFELLLPELVRQAKELRLSLPYDDWSFVDSIRADKLARIPPIALYGGTTTLTTSLEYLGDRLAIGLADRCQASNGSFGASPAATAYVCMRQPNDSGEEFLHRLVASSASGGVAFLHPFRMCELAWALRALIPFKDDLSSYGAAVEALSSFWTSQGMHSLDVGLVPDCDTTAITAEVFQAKG
jgi:halimadienyl-diphosphate synthase